MKTESAYNSNTYNRDLESELERLHGQVLLSWEKESRTLGWFGLKDGMSVLEVGSGSGFFTEKLLDLLPRSSVTAVEIDPVLHQKAKQYLQDKAGDCVSFIQASILDTGLPANSFDFAIARLVLCHIPTPVDAAKEIFRLLKPGGKLIIIDSDTDLLGITEPSSSTPLIMEKFQQYITSRGGDPLAGRHLCRILSKAGFTHIDLEAVVSHSDILGLEAFQSLLDSGPLFQLVKFGLLSEQEIQGFIVSRKKFLDSPHPLIMNIWLMACGKKPSFREIDPYLFIEEMEGE